MAIRFLLPAFCLLAAPLQAQTRPVHLNADELSASPTLEVYLAKAVENKASSDQQWLIYEALPAILDENAPIEALEFPESGLAPSSSYAAVSPAPAPIANAILWGTRRVTLFASSRGPGRMPSRR